MFLFFESPSTPEVVGITLVAVTALGLAGKVLSDRRKTKETEQNHQEIRRAGEESTAMWKGYFDKKFVRLEKIMLRILDRLGLKDWGDNDDGEN